MKCARPSCMKLASAAAPYCTDECKWWHVKALAGAKRGGKRKRSKVV